MRDAISARKVGRIADAYAEREDSPAARADEQRPALAEQPDPEPAPLHRQAAAAQQLALVVAEQVAEQSERDRLACPLAGEPRPSGTTESTARPACRRQIR